MPFDLGGLARLSEAEADVLHEPELVSVTNCRFDEVHRELLAATLESSQERRVVDERVPSEEVCELEVCQVIGEYASVLKEARVLFDESGCGREVRRAAVELVHEGPPGANAGDH